MEYIIVLEPESKHACLMENDKYFIETFTSYEEAKSEGEFWKRAGDCDSYAIYQLVNN